MATATTSPQEIGARLNELYWNSGRTIDDIVSDLGVGRTTLYSSVQPLPAGEKCAACGGQLAFGNRTDRAAGVATCQGCGREMDVGDGRLADEEPTAGTHGHPAHTWMGAPMLAEIAPRRVAMIGGAAAIGALCGVAAVRSFRH